MSRSGQGSDLPLQVVDGDGVHPREGFVEQHEAGFTRQCPGDFDPPPLAAGKSLADVVADTLKS